MVDSNSRMVQKSDNPSLFSSTSKKADDEHRAAQREKQRGIEAGVKEKNPLQTGTPHATHTATVNNKLDDRKHYPEDMVFARLPNAPNTNAGSFVANVCVIFQNNVAVPLPYDLAFPTFLLLHLSLRIVLQSGTLLPDVNGKPLSSPRRHQESDSKKTAVKAPAPHGGPAVSSD
jgi:hypothetical protein